MEKRNELNVVSYGEVTLLNYDGEGVDMILLVISKNEGISKWKVKNDRTTGSRYLSYVLSEGIKLHSWEKFRLYMRDGSGAFSFMVQYVYDPLKNKLFRVKRGHVNTIIEKHERMPIVVKSITEVYCEDMGDYYVLHEFKKEKPCDFKIKEESFVFYPKTGEIFKLREVFLK